jgi:hypothetical protein
MLVMVYSYTQMKCSKCGAISVITPGNHDTEDIFKLSCGCDKTVTENKRTSNGKQTKKDSSESR